ncbi:MAG: hypothetical protein J0M12_12000 [Deltaproteobacteria bacterium]|nr:hypothetical protein [Deltaproteobacteria bacterium]
MNSVPQALGSRAVPLAARVQGLLAEIVANSELLYQAKGFSQGPVCILVPQAMGPTVQRFRSVFSSLDLEHRIYFAHKANKSCAFVQQAEKLGIGIDVASKAELSSALSAGFTGERIICTGPKNRLFLRVAAKHSCLICVDSVMELKMLSEEVSGLSLSSGTKVLVRISDIRARDRMSFSHPSRFGVPKRDLDEVFTLLRANPRIELAGFHIHNDVRDKDAKAGFIDDLIGLIERAYGEGFTPSMLDLGGGFRSVRIQSAQEWSRFLDGVASGLLQKSDTGTWRRFGLGMAIGDKGAVIGRERIQGKYSSDEEFDDVLSYVLADESFRGRELSRILVENGITVMVEPGMALLQQCALTVFRVVGRKQAADGSELVLVDGNIYNLSLGVTEPMTDPILIARSERPAAAFEGYVVGNMCREEDIITKRRIPFAKVPEEGDLLCFVNTAPYNCDFEDASPHLHPRTTRIVAWKTAAKWSLCAEEFYDPYGMDNNES